MGNRSNGVLMASQKVGKSVPPAKAGVQNSLIFLDSGFRRNDGKYCFRAFYETVCIGVLRN